MAKIAKTADRSKVMDNVQGYGLSQMQKGNTHCETGKGSRARSSGWSLHLLLGL